MNLQKMMKQMQTAQAKMQEMQEKLGEMEVTGEAGGGMVKIVMTAKGEAKRVTLDKNAVDPDDLELLEDLLVAAINDGKTKGEALAQEQMQEMAEAMGLPPGMQMPF